MPTDPQPAQGAPSGAGSRFRADIQGLRAVAVLVVVVFHTGAAMSGGFVGVDVFFVISGFVIVGSLDAEHRRTSRVDVGRFYLRRVRRLLPALALLLTTVALLAPWFGPRTDDVTAEMTTGGSLFASNFTLLRLAQGYFDSGAEWNPLLHLWTLSLEEQVYFVVPAAMVALGALARWRSWSWRRTVAGATALGALGSFGLALVLAGGIVTGFGEAAAEGAFYLAPTRVWEFLAGALLALAAPRLGGIGAPARQGCGVAGLVLLGWAVLSFDGATAFPQVAGLVPVVAAVLLIAAGFGAGSLVSRVLATPAMGWVGDRSYSWYLWHWPVIVFARATFPGSTWAPVAAGALSLVPAALAYRFVEDPIRRRRPIATRPTVALALSCIAVPLVLAQTVVPVGERLDDDPAVEQTLYAARPHVDQDRLCNDSLEGSVGADACTWPVEGGPAAGRALLLGDSNAGHFSEGFILAAHAEGLDATIQTRAACPVADLHVRRDGFDEARCRAWFDEQVAWVLAERPTVVVIAQAGDLLMEKPEVEFSSDGSSGGYRADDDAQEEMWRIGFEAVLARFADAGIPTVVVAPIPRFTGWPGLGGCARVRMRSEPSTCGATRDPSERPVDRAEDAAVAAVAEVVPVDLEPVLCPGGTCRTRGDGIWLWKDESHLSVDGSEFVAPELQAAIAIAVADG